MASMYIASLALGSLFFVQLEETPIEPDAAIGGISPQPDTIWRLDKGIKRPWLTLNRFWEFSLHPFTKAVPGVGYPTMNI